MRGPASREPWCVDEIGRFPELTWALQFFRSTDGYFWCRRKGNFLQPAVVTDVRLSPRSWFDKVAIRHSHGYHPLMNVRAWIRLPFGLAYSLIPLAAGAGVTVGGCMLDAAGPAKGRSASSRSSEAWP